MNKIGNLSLKTIYAHVEELLLVGDEMGETPAQVLVNIALELWTVYGQSEDLRNRIEDTLHNIGIYVLEQGYDLIETIIRQVLGGLSTEKFIYFIESKVEDDLSWIRINGAIVGAIAGLVCMDLPRICIYAIMATIHRLKIKCLIIKRFHKRD